ncbi:beta-1,3-galactosyltransferase 1-like [Sinocyclocheilus rhinocerous]|uniref:beta-1,3-galactosyltransferase 1-like n=1 Tax=Sinocyclocheilus rhinocerous TaxID=307959 RepID=UPI0007B92383|nr:PREDICTED: beta-1,3-galactosyltransferase 1-like [Sinocyclocheilus rhinocerous]
MRKRSRYKLLKYFAIAGLITFVVILVFNSTIRPSPPKKTPAPKELYNVISPSTYKFNLNQPELCENRSPFLVLMIPVTLKDTEARTAIRRTWGQDGLIPGVTILHLFVIGQPAQRDPVLQEHLEKESKEYGDIIQMDFVDSYHNLTIKTMMIMNWIATYCQGAWYAMKIDADIFLNVRYLVDYLHDQSESSRKDFITGSVISDAVPHRDSFNKWYISEDLYPDSWYPPYVSGAAYVFSTDLARKISWASRFVRPIPLEDVYVGLCLHVLGVKPVYATTFLGFRNLFEVRRLKYERCTFAKRIIVNGFNPQNLLRIWHDFQKSYFTC